MSFINNKKNENKILTQKVWWRVNSLILNHKRKLHGSSVMQIMTILGRNASEALMCMVICIDDIHTMHLRIANSLFQPFFIHMYIKAMDLESQKIG